MFVRSVCPWTGLLRSVCSSKSQHTSCSLVTGRQTCALPIYAPYVPGWDCHGLPNEWKIEEEYRKKKQNKDEVPAQEFRAECRAYADKWVGVQKEQFKRLGVMGEDRKSTRLNSSH